MLNEETVKAIQEATAILKESNDKYEELITCDNCGEKYEEDYFIDNDFITSGGEVKICEQCVRDGYGR